MNGIGGNGEGTSEKTNGNVEYTEKEIGSDEKITRFDYDASAGLYDLGSRLSRFVGLN